VLLCRCRCRAPTQPGPMPFREHCSTWPARGMRVIGGGIRTGGRKHRGSDGPVTICVTASVSRAWQRARARGGATAGDDLWVSGQAGRRALAVAPQHRRQVRLTIKESARACRRRLDWPRPRCVWAWRCSGLATAAITAPNGLGGRYRHVLQRAASGQASTCREVQEIGHSCAGRNRCKRSCGLRPGTDYEIAVTDSPDTEAIAAAGKMPALANNENRRTVTLERGLRM